MRAGLAHTHSTNLRKFALIRYICSKNLYFMVEYKERRLLCQEDV
jgi:hypothetical protein